MMTTFYPPYSFGGDAICVQRLSQALVRRGHQVTVLQDVDAFNSLNRGRSPRSEEPSDGVEVIRLSSRAGAISVLLTQQTGRPVIQGRKIRRILDERDFDVINFHNVSLLGGPGLLSSGNGLKLYMAHEHWLVCPSHVLWRHNREACDGRDCLRCVLNYRRPPQFWRYSGYLDRQLKHVDTFIAVSEFSRDKHREFGFPRDMEVVNNFLPADSTPPSIAAETSPHPKPYFLFAGRLERIKGLDDVVPAFRKYPEADFLIAGDGQHAEALKELAAGIPNVRFLGSLDSETLDRFYRHALALIVPSAGFETFGIILIEAFRQSTPVIARDIGPFPEILSRSGGGKLFGNEEELLAAMRQIQNDPALRLRLATAGHEAFLRNWSESAVVPQYLEVVRKTALAKGRTDIARKIQCCEPREKVLALTH
jgi:glycosyltransferase involved in cell wall biosynthesis